MHHIKVLAPICLTLTFAGAVWAQATIAYPDPQVSIWYNGNGSEIRLTHSAIVSDPNGGAPDNATYWVPYIEIARDAGFSDHPMIWPYGGGGWVAQTSYACGGNTTPPALLTNQPSNLVMGGACGTTTGVGYPDWRVYGLVPGQTYYVRCVGCLSIDSTGDCGSVPERYDMYVGASVSVITPMLPPAASTQPASGISASAATLNGSVNVNNINTSYWFEWGLTVAYGSTTPPGAIAAGVGPSSWTAQPVGAPIGGLTAGQTYHFRVVAQSAAGTTYGNDQTFVALALPSVTTLPASGITTSSAVLNATVNPNAVGTNWYFEYGLSPGGPYPNVTAGGSLPGSSPDTAVSVTITALTTQTQYYYHVRAYNPNGPATGLEANFMTLSATSPVVTTGIAQSVGTTSAVLTGTLNPNGYPATYRFEYGLTAAYGTSTPAQAAGSGTSDVYAQWALTGLSSGQTYHYRLLGTNSAGTTYGADAVFLTAPLQAPAAETQPPTSVSYTSAVLAGIVNASGSPTTYQFQCGPMAGGPYPILSTVGNAGSGTGDVWVSRVVSGLLQGTTYYYRITATNPAGTATGAEMSFATTNAAPGAPIAVTLDPTSITSTSAVFEGRYDTRGLQGQAYFEWGSSSSLGQLTSAQSVNSDAEIPFSRAVAGLSANTQYYVRAVVTTTAGTAYGDVVSFQTASTPTSYLYFEEFGCAWIPIRSPQLIGGVGALGSARKSQATLTWTGTGITLYSIRDKILAKMRVTIDGRKSIVDLHTSGPTQWAVSVYAVHGLRPGMHTLTVSSAAPKKAKRYAIFVNCALPEQ